MTPEQIAQVCHEANRGLQAADPAPGIPVAPSWDDFVTEKDGAIAGVKGVLSGNTPEQSHQSWCEHKIRNGCTWGETKDATLKTHPCLVPYAELPSNQRVKDTLFAAVVLALSQWTA